MKHLFGFVFDMWRGLWFYAGHYIERVDNALFDFTWEGDDD